MTVIRKNAGDARFILLHPEGSATVLCLSWSRNGGLGCNAIMALDDNNRTQPLETIAERIASGEEIAVMPSVFPVALVRDALLQTREASGFSQEHHDAVSQFFTEILGKEGIEIWKHLGTRNTASNLNQFKQVDYLGSGDRKARRQAIWAYPLEYMKLIEGYARGTIDKRRPLAPEMAREYALDPGQAKIFSQIQKRIGDLIRTNSHPRMDGMASSRDSKVAQSPVIENREIAALATSEHVRRAARVLDPGQIPPDERNLLGLMRFMRHVERLQRESGITDPPFDRLMRRVKPDDWARQADLLPKRVKAREVRDYIEKTGQAIRNAIIVDGLRTSDAFDLSRIANIAERLWSGNDISADDATMIKQFSDGLADHFMFGNTVASNAVIQYLGQLLTDHASLKVIDKLQTRWHHQRESVNNDTMSTSQSLTWPAFVGEITLNGGITARELNGTTLLAEQGQREEHCVGGYASHILNADKNNARLIFSLEEAGKILSTLEVTMVYRDNETNFSITQNRAFRNSEPCLAAKTAAAALITHICDIDAEKARTYLESIRGHTGNAMEKLNLTLTRIGANMTNPKLPETILEKIDPVLPKGLRGMDVTQWRDRMAQTSIGRHQLNELDLKVHDISKRMIPDQDACITERRVSELQL